MVRDAAQAMAVANAVAPEHLELMSADPAALVEQVHRHERGLPGPVRPQPAWATAWPSPATSFRRTRTARFAGKPAEVDDFCKHIHVVSLDQRALAHVTLRAAIAQAEGFGGPRRVRDRRRPSPGAARAGVGDDATTVTGLSQDAAVRPQHPDASPAWAGSGTSGDLALQAGLSLAPDGGGGSPERKQVRRSRRRGWLEAVVEELHHIEIPPLLTGRHGRCAGSWPTSTVLAPESVFCCWVNEVLQTLCLAYGVQGGGRSPSSRPTRCTAASPT